MDGWTKGLELAKVARRDRQHFDCATWLHKARELPKEDFRREVERELTGREEEPSELICFKGPPHTSGHWQPEGSIICAISPCSGLFRFHHSE